MLVVGGQGARAEADGAAGLVETVDGLPVQGDLDVASGEDLDLPLLRAAPGGGVEEVVAAALEGAGVVEVPVVEDVEGRPVVVEVGVGVDARRGGHVEPLVLPAGADGPVGEGAIQGVGVAALRDGDVGEVAGELRRAALDPGAAPARAAAAIVAAGLVGAIPDLGRWVLGRAVRVVADAVEVGVGPLGGIQREGVVGVRHAVAVGVEREGRVLAVGDPVAVGVRVARIAQAIPVQIGLPGIRLARAQVIAVDHPVDVPVGPVDHAVEPVGRGPAVGDHGEPSAHGGHRDVEVDAPDPPARGREGVSVADGQGPLGASEDRPQGGGRGAGDEARGPGGDAGRPGGRPTDQAPARQEGAGDDQAVAVPPQHREGEVAGGRVHGELDEAVVSVAAPQRRAGGDDRRGGAPAVAVAAIVERGPAPAEAPGVVARAGEPGDRQPAGVRDTGSVQQNA